MRFYTPSGGGGRLISCRAGPVELEHVVRCADQRPFGADFVDAAQQELAEALRLFDLSEDRLDDGLTPRVDTLARLAHQFAFHPLDQRGRLRDAAPGTARHRLVMLLFARSHVQVDLLLCCLA
jgi:hypothetical protein